MNDKINALQASVEALELQQAQLIAALQTLLPITLTACAATQNSAEATKKLVDDLQSAQDAQPRSDLFWELASPICQKLSDHAVEQHPEDQQALAIYQGLRDHKRH